MWCSHLHITMYDFLLLHNNGKSSFTFLCKHLCFQILYIYYILLNFSNMASTETGKHKNKKSTEEKKDDTKTTLVMSKHIIKIRIV